MPSSACFLTCPPHLSPHLWVILGSPSWPVLGDHSGSWAPLSYVYCQDCHTELQRGKLNSFIQPGFPKMERARPKQLGHGSCKKKCQESFERRVRIWRAFKRTHIKLCHNILSNYCPVSTWSQIAYLKSSLTLPRNALEVVLNKALIIHIWWTCPAASRFWLNVYNLVGLVLRVNLKLGSLGGSPA